MHLDSVVTSAGKMSSVLWLTDGSLCSLSPIDKEIQTSYLGLFCFFDRLNMLAAGEIFFSPFPTPFEPGQAIPRLKIKMRFYLIEVLKRNLTRLFRCAFSQLLSAEGVPFLTFGVTQRLLS